MVARVRRNDGLLLGSTQQGLISRGMHTHTQRCKLRWTTGVLLLFIVSLAAIVNISFTGIMRGPIE